MAENFESSMTILHYTLGLPPRRSGGLTRYATDLMLEQQKSAKVMLLYPSGYNPWSRSIRWKRDGSYHGVDLIKLKNSFPVPLLYGIREPKDFISNRIISVDTMEALYSEFRPDVFHVHTLMGLPKELLLFFKSKGVRLIFTSHDYFGICPKVNMVDYAGKICAKPSAERCARCNKGVRGTLFLRLRNSKLLLDIKRVNIIRKIIGR